MQVFDENALNLEQKLGITKVEVVLIQTRAEQASSVVHEAAFCAPQAIRSAATRAHVRETPKKERRRLFDAQHERFD